MTPIVFCACQQAVRRPFGPMPIIADRQAPDIAADAGGDAYAHCGIAHQGQFTDLRSRHLHVDHRFRLRSWAITDKRLHAAACSGRDERRTTIPARSGSARLDCDQRNFLPDGPATGPAPLSCHGALPAQNTTPLSCGRPTDPGRSDSPGHLCFGSELFRKDSGSISVHPDKQGLTAATSAVANLRLKYDHASARATLIRAVRSRCFTNR